MTDIETARQILCEGHYTCVLYRNGEQYCSRERGVAPLLQWLVDDTSYLGFSAADRVVGNGAAYLYVLLGIKALYAVVISQSALQTLNQHSITVTYDTLTSAIQNRSRTGLCPIEQAVKDVSSPQEALAAIQNRLCSLRDTSANTQ